MFFATFINKKTTNQFQYIINTFSQIYRIPCKVLHLDELRDKADNNLLISYGTNIPPRQGKHIHIYESDFFGEGYLTQKSLPRTPLPRYNDLPILYLGGDKIEPFITRNDDLIETNIDLIASSFFLLTRYEEVVNNDKTILDQHERFPATLSIAYKESFLHRPLVNECFELLWSCIKALNPNLEKKQLWNGKDFALCLTHDIDTIQNTPLSEALIIASLLLKQHSLEKATARTINNIKVVFRKKNISVNTFSQIFDIEQRYGASSTFFFMTEPDYSGGYCLNNLKVKNVLNKISDAGNEIGLHAGYYSYNNKEIINTQKTNLTEILKLDSIGCRQHFLRWKTPNTWRIQEKCGLNYDTTLCFADHEGFRAGICHPFQPFDIQENRIFNIWEIPLTIMDGSLYYHRKLTPKEGLITVESYMNTVRRYQGVMVLLWHNSFFDPDIYPGWADIYDKILDSAIKNNALCTSAKDILKTFSESL
jgi:peptidoglycan/xylan/chitin deacetylase (PgdA/CDA1 family)